MKIKFLTFALAVLTVGLLGSCSKLNERLDNLDKRVDGIENNQIASIEQQIAGINTSINDLKSADAAVNSKIAELKKTAEAQQALIDALKAADQALGQKDDALEGRIVILEGQDDVIAGQIEALEDADKAINDRIANLKSYVDAELVKVNDWAKATFATLAQYQQTADDLAALSVTVSGISTTLSEVQTSIAGLDTKIDGIDAALQGKIAEAKTELEGKIAALRTELEGKIASAISTSETSLKGWVNNKLGAYYTAAQMDAKIAGLRSEINNLKSDEEAGKSKTAELETKLTQLTQDLAAAKTNIKAAYEAAITEAINTNNGIINQTIENKINEVNVTITNLTDRVTVLEEEVGILTGRMDAAEEKINTIEQQIAAINQSISDLEAIRTSIQELMAAKEAMGEDITVLKAKDQALEGKITNLKNYVDTELAKYVTTEWANATFATLEVQAEIIADVAKLKQDLEDLDTKLGTAITALETSLRNWVNEKLTAYYTKAEMDEKIAALQVEIAYLKNRDAANRSKIEELETKLAQLKDELEVAKATIKAEYKEAIREAIDENNGIINRTIDEKIDQVNQNIYALSDRMRELERTVGDLKTDVEKLKAMIQSVSITPAYSDGSVEADKNGILTIKCIVKPAEALNRMESLKDSLLIYADSVTVKTKAATSAYMEIKVDEASVLDAKQGAITLKANISNYLPKGKGKALTIALYIKNGISDYTTEFVPVYVVPVEPYVIIEAKYDGNTVTSLKWYRQNLAITASGKKAWKEGNTSSAVKVPGTDDDVIVGDYFQWAASYKGYNLTAENQKPENLLIYTAFTNKGCGDGSDGFTFIGSKQFNLANAPYYSGSNYTKYYNDDTKSILERTPDNDDVASIILGGTWRMPTSDEIKAMKDATYWAWDATDKGYYVYAPQSGDEGKANNGIGTYEKSDALLFFPAAGYGNGTSLDSAGSRGYYWSSSLYSSSTNYAYRLSFLGGRVSPQSYDDRYYGYSVRPVSD